MGTVYLGEHTLARPQSRDQGATLGAVGERGYRQAVLQRSAGGDADRRSRHRPDLRLRLSADGSAFIVMELLEGEAMDQRLERIGRFGLVECLRLMRMICTSLGAAHAKGIVHRDLKPENLARVG
jgi:serine/threonine-protein kinase